MLKRTTINNGISKNLIYLISFILTMVTKKIYRIAVINNNVRGEILLLIKDLHVRNKRQAVLRIPTKIFSYASLPITEQKSPI